MPTIEVSEKVKQEIDKIRKEGFRFVVWISNDSVDDPKTDDEVISGLLWIANGEGYIEMLGSE